MMLLPGAEQAAPTGNGGTPEPLSAIAERIPVFSLRAARASRGRVICGVDGSAEGFRAALLADELAARLDSSLLLVHVWEEMRPEVHEPAPSPRSRADMERSGTQLLLAVADLTRDRSRVEVRVEFGEPADRLSALAGSEPSDLLVIGAHGRDGHAAPLGAVASRLARCAPVPVVVLDEPPKVAWPPALRPDQWHIAGGAERD